VRRIGVVLIAALASSATLHASAVPNLELPLGKASVGTTSPLTARCGSGEMTLVHATPGLSLCEYPDTSISVGVMSPKPSPYSAVIPALFCVASATDLSIDVYRADGSQVASFDFVEVPPGQYSVELHGYRSLGVISFGIRVGAFKIEARGRMVLD
jgi:hypothetical protein